MRLQTSAQASWNSFTAPAPRRFFNVIDAMGAELSLSRHLVREAMRCFDRCRSMVKGRTVRKRPLASKFSRM